MNLVELGGAKRVFGLNDLTRGEAVPRNPRSEHGEGPSSRLSRLSRGSGDGIPEGWDNDIEEAR